MNADSKCITDLPVELLANIFSYLSPRDLICGVKQVCRQWESVVSSDNQVWKSVFYKPGRSSSCSTIIFFLEQAPQLRNVIFTNKVSPEVLEALLNNCPLLRKLELSYSQKLRIEFYEKLAERCSTIEHLVFRPSVATVTQFIGVMRNLKSLELFGENEVDLGPLSDGCPSLQSLDMSYIQYSIQSLSHLMEKKKDQLHTLRLTVVGVHLEYSLHLITMCRLLKVLYIMFPYFCPEEGLVTGLLSLRMLTSLTSLTLDTLCGIDVAYIMNVFESRGMQQLEELTIISYRKYKDALSNIITQNCPRLKLLHLSHCYELTDASLEGFPKLCLMESIELKNSNITDRGLMYLVNCRGLKYLDLSNCGKLKESLELIVEFSEMRILILDGCNVSNLPVRLIARRMKHLTLLSIVDCINVDKDAMRQIKFDNCQLICKGDNSVFGIDEFTFNTISDTDEHSDFEDELFYLKSFVSDMESEYYDELD